MDRDLKWLQRRSAEKDKRIGELESALAEAREFCRKIGEERDEQSRMNCEEYIKRQKAERERDKVREERDEWKRAFSLRTDDLSEARKATKITLDQLESARNDYHRERIENERLRGLITELGGQ